MEVMRCDEVGQKDESVLVMRKLVSAVQKLSYARTIEAVVEIVKHAARELTGADGASFILREGDQCFYVDEAAISPLWKGRRFSMNACISGWVMLNQAEAVVADIHQDSRIPVDAYQPTFVKSLVMVPIRKEHPIGAIGTYWAIARTPDSYEVEVLQSLADSTSIAMENIQLCRDLQSSLQDARQARDEIARQLNLRDEFISISSHELKTPLTPMSMQAQYLERLILARKFKDHPDEARLKKMSDIFLRQIRDLSRLVDDLLDASRIRLDQFSIDLVQGVDLGELIRTTVDQFQPLTDSKILMVVDSPLLGKWDPLRLGQLLRNLVCNAISYGQGKPVTIRASVRDSVVLLVVEDQGIGISEENQKRIFNRFERATSMRSFSGMGLGLFISREIVRAHGGLIRVESELNRGSQFIVELPYQNDQ